MTMPGTAIPETAGSPEDGAEDLRARLRALRRFVELATPRVPADRLTGARQLLERAGRRLDMSGRHTVVALAGTTGSGKSSLFNAVSGLDLSRVAVRRPTTSELHACVWAPSGAEPLLDWLGVPTARRTARESALDGEDEAPLRGLVLLDLPDFDSVDPAHRSEVERLLGVVDLVVWVVDPQKYADRSVHEGHLRTMAGKDTTTAVVLNQIDRLSPTDARRCADDLRRLLVADGLPDVPLHPTSARTRDGIDTVRAVLADAVADRASATRRLSADLTALTGELADLAGGGRHVTSAEEPPDSEPLVAALSAAAGVPGLLDGAEADYRRRGRRATGWLFARPALGGHDPQRRLEQERYDLDWLAEGDGSGGTPDAGRAADDEPDGTEERPVPGPVRRYVTGAAATLPDPWRSSVWSAVRERQEALRAGLGRVADRLGRPWPAWWTVVTVLQWLLGGCAVAGLVWLAAIGLAGPLGYADPPSPAVGPLSVPVLLLLGGVVLGVGLAAALVPAVRAGAGEYRHRVSAELTAEVSAVARAEVLEPVSERLHEYAQSRAALAEASG